MRQCCGVTTQGSEVRQLDKGITQKPQQVQRSKSAEKRRCVLGRKDKKILHERSGHARWFQRILGNWVLCHADSQSQNARKETAIAVLSVGSHHKTMTQEYVAQKGRKIDLVMQTEYIVKTLKLPKLSRTDDESHHERKNSDSLTYVSGSDLKTWTI